MNEEEVLKHLCETMGMVYHSIGDYRYPSDGFCNDCPAAQQREWTFANSGWTLDFIRQAAKEKLEREKYKVINTKDFSKTDITWPI